MSSAAARPFHRFIGPVALLALAASALLSGAVRAVSVQGEVTGFAAVGHVVISELQTGGASASDEFAELYNPSAGFLSLDGLELVYVTASGATVTRKALWGAGAIPPGAHVLVANEAGVFAGIADVTYTNGLAAAGGSLALRAVGSASAIDAVGWGTAASTWLEISPAPAPPAGSSLERLPGGGAGSGQDTDNNVVDFVIRAAPDPQNSGSIPVPSVAPSASASATGTPSATPEPTSSPSTSLSESPSPSSAGTQSPSPSPTATPTASPTATPSHTSTPTPVPTPTPAPLTMVEARALPDGSTATVVGVSLTDSVFSEGGGYLADSTGGIAVIVTDGAFPRGAAVLVTGVVDDRYAQRTLRADASALTVLGPGPAPAPIELATGSVDETVEGQLISLTGQIQGAPTTLSVGLAFEIDDGSGPIRLLVSPATGIDSSTWLKDVTLSVIGVLGQRDSSGTGTEGYRVQPRDAGDVTAVVPPATPTPGPTPSASPSPNSSPTDTAAATPSASPPVPLVTIDEARHAAVGATLRVRGVITLPTGLVDASTAVIADPSGAILVRTGPAVGRLTRGQLLELSGVRSTKSGMLSLRVTARPAVLGRQPEPAPARRATGAVGESDEATLVVVRGLVRDGPRRTSGGGLSFTLNDGSGGVRVAVAPTTGITARHVPAGAWVELRAVVGQQTTGSAPNAGYRLWPRDANDVTLVARPRTGSGSGTAPTPKPTHGPSSKPLTPFVVAPVGPPNLSAHSPRPLPTSTPGATPDANEATKARLPISTIPLPLAAGLGGVAGLLALAWRTGTMTRAAATARLAVERARRGGLEAGIEEDESYTPAP